MRLSLSAFCYGVMINIDWFQPFDHYAYSLGVVYLVIMNLPRNQRYKRKNVITVGIIPGSHEPPLTINSYLSPLVDELWSGIQMKLPDSTEKTVRVALLAVACDMPASRKVCGFLSHSAAAHVVTVHFLRVLYNVIILSDHHGHFILIVSTGEMLITL